MFTLSLYEVTCLILTDAPLFEVENLDVCSTGRYLAVYGSRGINIVELPPKWGINGSYEGGKASVLSRKDEINKAVYCLLCECRSDTLQLRGLESGINAPEIIKPNLQCWSAQTAESILQYI
ncbi:unnamed protein product [Medioppia subpectinata]|uniref:Uncharacterized protein n=1 Tax=Medioppia subpectinata TaxID=1979941 RepID=A0A7R9KUE2_9ACAR|nr:unnamed protein product [Medioppia subpectinata]CAG2110062.1 unnamed protein product [Medioppia subpectinata]